MTDQRFGHWEHVWHDRDPTTVTWYQDDPVLSRRLIARVAATDAAVVDVGGGGSRLADHLLADGYRDITVLDIASEALDVSRRRLGPDADRVQWIVGDVTDWRPARRYDVWHDRAVFHFLVDAVDRDRYRRALAAGVRPGGHVIVATFGPDGPEQCSGLPVHRYDLAGLTDELGPVEPIEHVIEDHVAPSGVTQQFLVALFRFRPRD